MINVNTFRDTILALEKIRPDSQFTLFEDGEISWDSINEIEKPTDAEIATAIQQVLEERPLKQLRHERNKLIVETDWWVLPDRTPTQDQLDYRQALRDITNIYTSTDDVVWPEKPE